jgi:hypothetical protein
MRQKSIKGKLSLEFPPDHRDMDPLSRGMCGGCVCVSMSASAWSVWVSVCT